MRKSAIVLEVSRIRAENPPTEKQILKDLSAVLINRSIHLHEWDLNVDDDLAHSIIRHIRAVRGRLSMADLVSDIDLLIWRATTAASMAVR